MTPVAWTEERTTELKRLWALGSSASEIAKELGSTTRNAVLGKVHRLNLASRPERGNPRAQALPRRVQEKLERAPKPAKSKSKLVVTKYGMAWRSSEGAGGAVPAPFRGESRTSATYRSKVPFQPLETVGARRDFLAEAVRNTAAIQVSEAS